MCLNEQRKPNQRNSELKIEQDYISSLIEDAKTDLLNFDNVIALNEARIKNLDSLEYLSYNYDPKAETDAEIMVMYLQSIKNPDFVAQTDRTLSQLKNSGGMRLIKDKNKTNEIVKYEESFERLYNQQVWYEGGLKEMIDVGIPIFNYNYFPKRGEEFDEETFYKTARLLQTDKRLIIELGNRATISNALTQNYLRFLKEGKAGCLKLIAVLEENNNALVK